MGGNPWFLNTALIWHLLYAQASNRAWHTAGTRRSALASEMTDPQGPSSLEGDSVLLVLSSDSSSSSQMRLWKLPLPQEHGEPAQGSAVHSSGPRSMGRDQAWWSHGSAQGRQGVATDEGQRHGHCLHPVPPTWATTGRWISSALDFVSD